jgi:hypothetical protein
MVRHIALVLAVAVALVASCVGISTQSTAHAYTGEDVSLEELTRTSDVVVVGRVVRADVFAQGPNGLPGIHTKITLEAEEFFVGSPRSHVVFWVHGGRIGNRVRVVSGQARFDVGEHVAVFLFATSSGVLFPNGMAHGKRLISESGQDRSSPASIAVARLRALVGARE